MRIGQLRRLRRCLHQQQSSSPPKWTQLVKQMEEETDLAQNAALKVLYQKTQASLMFSIMKKMPSSAEHPLNTLRHKYFDGADRENEIGFKMFLVVMVTKALISGHTVRSADQLKRFKLAQLVELLYLAFEIQDCILEIKNDRNRAEIEDANRLCVLAGDFFMASASTQLAELENQKVVRQISKGIQDMSTGRAINVGGGGVDDVDGWIQITVLQHVQLLRKAVWSSFVLSGQEPSEELVSKDYKLQLDDERLDGGVELGLYFITNFVLLSQLQNSKTSHNFAHIENREIERALLHDRLAYNCTSALARFPSNNSTRLLESVVATYTE